MTIPLLYDLYGNTGSLDPGTNGFAKKNTLKRTFPTLIRTKSKDEIVASQLQQKDFAAHTT